MERASSLYGTFGFPTDEASVERVRRFGRDYLESYDGFDALKMPDDLDRTFDELLRAVASERPGLGTELEKYFAHQVDCAADESIDQSVSWWFGVIDRKTSLVHYGVTPGGIDILTVDVDKAQVDQRLEEVQSIPSSEWESEVETWYPEAFDLIYYSYRYFALARAWSRLCADSPADALVLANIAASDQAWPSWAPACEG
jgi:hypothetical protein